MADVDQSSTRPPCSPELAPLRRELAATVASQAEAIANGTVVGPQWAAVRRLQANVDTLLAWTADDRG